MYSKNTAIRINGKTDVILWQFRRNFLKFTALKEKRVVFPKTRFQWKRIKRSNISDPLGPFNILGLIGC